MDGLRSFIEKIDNHSALDVGHLHKGQRPFKVQRPKFSGDNSEVLREVADDLTLRAEEVNTLQASMLITFWVTVGDRLWWTQIGTPFAKQF